MAVTPEDMMRLQAALSAQAPVAPAPADPASAMPGQPLSEGPAGAPMTQPEMPEGQRMAAMAEMGTALDIMQNALPKLGVDSPEGQAVQQAMMMLAEVFGNYRSRMTELQPAQIMQLMRALPTQMQGQQPMQGGMQNAQVPGAEQQGLP